MGISYNHMQKFTVILKRKNSREQKNFTVEASSEMDAMSIALKQKENEGYYVYGTKKS